MDALDEHVSDSSSPPPSKRLLTDAEHAGRFARRPLPTGAARVLPPVSVLPRAPLAVSSLHITPNSLAQLGTKPPASRAPVALSGALPLPRTSFARLASTPEAVVTTPAGPATRAVSLSCAAKQPVVKPAIQSAAQLLPDSVACSLEPGGNAAAPPEEQEKRPVKRRRVGDSKLAVSEAVAAPRRAPAAGARGNFVRHNLRKGGGKKFSGGRKFVTGAAAAAAPKPRRTRFSHKRPVFADSTAPAAPIMVDTEWAEPLRTDAGAPGVASIISRPPARNRQQAPPLPVVAPPPVPPSAATLCAIEAARVALESLGADAMPEALLVAVLSAVWGFPSFRDGQLHALRAILSRRSTLSILPTGGGKSLVYMLAALLVRGACLVVSPLLALMDDQLAHLPSALPGAVLHSAQSSESAAATCAELRAGRLKVLFVSPERLLSRAFVSIAAALPEEARFTLACVDECHCVSEARSDAHALSPSPDPTHAQWSHNFRPAYYRLGQALRESLGIDTVLALTATATRRTEAAVASTLQIQPSHIQRNAAVRQNLRLTVSRVVDRERSLLSTLKPGGLLASVASVIVYCAYKGQADRLAQYLFTHGVAAVSYHAGKAPAERTRAQALFLANRVRVIAATTAFGMGLDKPDVGAVVNFGLPRSIEAYVQQVGRGGRDGSEALCHSFVDDEEYLRLRSLSFSDGVDQKELSSLLDMIFPADGSALGTCGCVDLQIASAEVGMRQEMIETVLAYLQLPNGVPGETTPYLSALPDMRPTLHIAFHRANAAVAESSPLAAQVLKLGRAKGGKHTVRIPALATGLGVSFSDVQDQLRDLCAAGDVSFTLADYALCFTVLRFPAKKGALATALATRLAEAEACQVGKIDTLFVAATASLAAPDSQGQETVLRQHIRTYFEAAEGTECAPPPGIVKQASSYLAADIRALLRTGREALGTPRSVALVLHGLQSARVSAEAWRSHPSWGKHTAVDFGTVLRACRNAMASNSTTH